MRIVSSLAIFGVVRYQLYKSQALSSFFSLLMAFNSNAKMKSFSMFMARVRIKLFSSKSKDEIF